jgi:putative transposase
MSSFSIIYIHAVFSTKFREPLIEADIEHQLQKYIAGIGRNKGIPIINSGGMSDHIHILLKLPSTMSISSAMHLIKGSTSKWINDTFYEDRRFKWQGGYSAFSVSRSNVEQVKSYISNQKEHHRYYSFEEEHKKMLLKHGVVLNNKTIDAAHK